MVREQEPQKGARNFIYLSRARYRTLTETLEPDETKPEAKYYLDNSDEMRELEKEYAWEDEKIASANTPTADDYDEE